MFTRGTQNAYEYVNSVIWSRLPKSNMVLRKPLEFAVYAAIASFNSGNLVKCRILAGLGTNCIRTIENIDNTRIQESQKAVEEIHNVSTAAKFGKEEAGRQK